MFHQCVTAAVPKRGRL